MFVTPEGIRTAFSIGSAVSMAVEVQTVFAAVNVSGIVEAQVSNKRNGRRGIEGSGQRRTA